MATLSPRPCFGCAHPTMASACIIPAAPRSLIRSCRFAPAPLRTVARRGCILVTASGGGSSTVPAAERILSGISYLLPLLDGMQYGRYVFAQYSVAETIFRPLFPLLRFYSSIPFSNFIAFFTLYLTVVRNPNFSRYVRFNAMQACVLDVLIILPLIAQRILNPRSGIGLELLVIFYNTLFIFLLVCVVFGVASCLLGKTPRLPIVADAAENQLY